jgi:hypothetical protein
MAQPTYYDLAGNVVEFYHPADALEALELGAITTGKSGVDEAPKKEEVPVVEEVKEAPAAEQVEEAPKKRAPRRRFSE